MKDRYLTVSDHGLSGSQPLDLSHYGRFLLRIISSQTRASISHQHPNGDGLHDSTGRMQLMYNSRLDLLVCTSWVMITITSGYAAWFTAGGAIRIAHYDVIDDVITRKL